MAERALTIKIVGDAKDMRRAARDVISSLDETESAGKRLAREMDRMSTSMQQDIRDAADTTRRLEEALGTDTVAALQSVGRNVEDMVREWKQAGVTYDELRADADVLADSLRRSVEAGRDLGTIASPAQLAEANVKALGDQADYASTKVQNVHDSADQSRSVLANMVGNSAQDLGALGGVAGTAGMAIGQMAEYATEGNINLNGLAKVAGPMAGVTAAVIGVTWAIGQYKKASADAAEETKNLKSAQEDLAEGNFDEAARTLADQYANTIPLLQKYGFSSQDLADTLGGQSDVIEDLNVLLDDVHERYQAVQLDAYNGDAAAQALSDSLGAQSEELIGLIETLTGARTEYQGIAEDTKNRTQLEEDLSLALRMSSGELVENTENTEDAAEAQQKARDAAQERLDIERELYGFLLSQIDAQRAYEVAVDDGEDAVRQYNDTLASGESTLEDIDDAARSAADTLISQAEAFAQSKGAADGSREAIGLQIEELYGLATAMDPNSPLRSRLLDYITELQSIPAQVDTMLKLNISAGATVTQGGDFIGIRPVPGSSSARAQGGSALAGRPYVVGDNPDGSFNSTTELFIPDASGQVMSAGSMRMGGGVTIVNLNGYISQAMVDELAVGLYRREQGRR